MCGVAGFCFSNDSCINARHLTRALLEAIEERGREASGYAYPDADGNIYDNCAPLPAKEFVKSRREFRMDAAARTAIMHTRLATKGTVNNPLNNHPVLSYADTGETIAAVHNGGVWNDDEAFERFELTRYGQVDSEIIPAMIAKYGSAQYAEIFNELTGGIATAWLDERNPGTLHMLRAWDSPMVFASIDVLDKLGLKIKGVIFASTVKALTAALGALGLDWSMDGVKQFEIGEGEFLFAENGEWDGLVYPFALPDMTSRWGGTWRGRNRRTQGDYNPVYGYWNMYDEDDWDGLGTGIGSGRVGTGKPSVENNPDSDDAEHAGVASTFIAGADGTLERVTDDGTPLALDTSLDEAQAGAEVAAEAAALEQSLASDGWDEEIDRWKALDVLADKRKDPEYMPDAAEMKLLATLTDSERVLLGVTLSEVADMNGDLMWHMEACSDGNCAFNNPDCPQGVDFEDPSALRHAARVWGMAALID